MAWEVAESGTASWSRDDPRPNHTNIFIAPLQRGNEFFTADQYLPTNHPDAQSRLHGDLTADQIGGTTASGWSKFIAIECFDGTPVSSWDVVVS